MTLSDRQRRQAQRKGIISKQDLDVANGNFVTGTTRKQRRTATDHKRHFTKSQRKILERYFKKNSMPSSSEEESIVKMTGLQIMQVKRWFRYRRSVLKKTILKERNQEETPSNTTNRLSLQLTAIPLSTPQLLNFPPKPVRKPTTCYRAYQKRTNSGSNNTQLTRPEQSYSPYDGCSSTLQICDKLLQNMFGYDWIEKLRLHRTI